MSEEWCRSCYTGFPEDETFVTMPWSNRSYTWCPYCGALHDPLEPDYVDVDEEIDVSGYLTEDDEEGDLLP